MAETRRERIMATVTDCVTDLLFYDRKEDEELGVGQIEEAVQAGEITKKEIVAEFSRCLGALEALEPGESHR